MQVNLKSNTIMAKKTEIVTRSKSAVPIDSPEQIESLIHTIRNQQVMLDRDLAILYGVSTSRLNEQVKRNIARFPESFRFQLTKDECSKSQIATMNAKRGQNIKYLPYAFTEQGIAKLSSVLHSYLLKFIVCIKKLC